MVCEAHPPLDPATGKLTSRYGVRPGRRTGAPTFHAGLDLRSEPISGAPVYAVARGRVAVLGLDRGGPEGMRGYGNAVVLLHDLTWRDHHPLWTLSAHLSELAVEADQVVEAGQLIGRTGNSSNGKFPGMGPHLHFELRHAARAGAPPLSAPVGVGTYRAYNMDPEPWLASLGVRFGRRGEIEWTRRCSTPLAFGHVGARLRNPWWPYG